MSAGQVELPIVNNLLPFPAFTIQSRLQTCSDDERPDSLEMHTGSASFQPGLGVRDNAGPACRCAIKEGAMRRLLVSVVGLLLLTLLAGCSHSQAERQ